MADRQSRDEKLAAIQEKLEEGIRNVYTNDMPAYLQMLSKMHQYSVSNSILILSQRPDTSGIVGGMKFWNSMGRKVKKHEKGISILAPVKRKTEMEHYVYDSDGSMKRDPFGNPVREKRTKEYLTFRPVYVWDKDQTEGEPLPEIVHTLTGDVNNYEQLKQVLIDTSPVPITFENIPGSTNGYYAFTEGAQRIVVQEGMPQMQTIKTMLHELSHQQLDHGGKDDKTDTHVKEVTAEASAYMCACMLGLAGVENYSAGYLVSWSKDRDVSELKENLELIKKTASTLYDRILKGFEKIQDKTRENIIQPGEPLPAEPVAGALSSNPPDSTEKGQNNHTGQEFRTAAEQAPVSGSFVSPDIRKGSQDPVTNGSNRRHGTGR